MNRATANPKVKKKLPGPNTKKWVTYHLKNASKATYEHNFVWDRSAPAIGPFCTDPDGNIFLDFASHVAVNPLGYNHPELIDVARQLAAIDPDRYAGTDFIGAFGKDPGNSKLPTPSHLHEKVLEITKSFGFKKAFFSNSGTEAVETAMKLCYQYRQNFGYGITFQGAFHGRTLGALSLNRSKSLHRSWYPQIPNIISLPYYPKYENDSLEAMLSSKTGLIRPEEVAFIIIEPIQGEGGYKIADAQTLQNIATLARKHGIPLICDEIQSGMGRTGKWWASEHFGIKPDIITSGKALRIGATIGNEKVFPKEEYRIGSTWGEGNAIASAVGYKTIEIIQRDELLKNATNMGNYLLKELKGLQKKFAQVVDEVRGIGLMDAIEFHTHEQSKKFQADALQKGIILLTCGHKTVRLLPPLNVTKREINIALEIIDATLKQIKK